MDEERDPADLQAEEQNELALLDTNTDDAVKPFEEALTQLRQTLVGPLVEPISAASVNVVKHARTLSRRLISQARSHRQQCERGGEKAGKKQRELEDEIARLTGVVETLTGERDELQKLARDRLKRLEAIDSTEEGRELRAKEAAAEVERLRRLEEEGNTARAKREQLEASLKA